MRLVRLTPDYDISSFDCGDEDLNGFLVQDAKGFLQNRIAYTYILEDDGNIVAYSAFRFITVDAYLQAVDFYKRNGFRVLNRKDEDERTRLMYFDMLEV